MKHVVALVLSFILICAGMAYALTIDEVIPTDDLWAISKKDFANTVEGDYTEIKVNKKTTLVNAGLEIEGATWDVYYVFGQNMKAHNGLSKVAYLLSGTGKKDKADLDEKYHAIVSAMEKVIGQSDSSTNTLTTWNRDKFKVEIGKGKFKAYNGSDNQNLAIVITGLNMPTPAPTAAPTPKPTEVPTVQKIIYIDNVTLGDYGKKITLNKDGRDSEYSFIGYYLPAGRYSAINLGKGAVQISIYVKDKTEYSDGIEYPISGSSRPVVLMQNDQKEFELKEDEYIKLPDGKVNLTLEKIG